MSQLQKAVKNIVCATVLTALSTTAFVGSAFASDVPEGYENPLAGWKILQDNYDQSNPLDIIAYEWDYFMIHDENFAGIIGYVVANPRDKLGDLIQIVPNGGSVGIVGEVHGRSPVANFETFGVENSAVGKDSRTFNAVDLNSDKYGTMTPMPGGAPDGSDAIHLEGRSTDFEWDVVVYQGMADRNYQRIGVDAPFTVDTATDVGILPNEEWTIDALWPRTNVIGTVKDLTTGETLNIDGKGYRENSWGRYLLSIDGWDFMVFSEEEEDGVLMVMQTYHKSEDLDFLDVSFYDNGQLKSERFRTNNGEFGWYHPKWRWDAEPRSCVPKNTVIKARNGDYIIEATVDIGNRQEPMLSNATIGTVIFFIQEHFPTVNGVIKRADTGAVVTTFEGQAGGEFAYHKDVASWHSSFYCNLWGWPRFYAPLP